MPEDFEFKRDKPAEPVKFEPVKDENIGMIRDKIKLKDEVMQNPPSPGDMKVDVELGAHEADLDCLLRAQLTDCPATIIPMLIDHGVRTAVDIKETYKPEKRIIEFQYIWIIIAIIGLLAVVLILGSVFGLF